MASRGSVKKKNPVVGWLKLIVVMAIVLVLLLGLDEMAANSGDGYRRSIWDRMTGVPEVPKGRAEVSIQLAQELCRQEIASQLGSMLIRAHFDGRSSRYDREAQVHTVFLDLEVANGETEVYARCDVSAVERMILEYRVKGWGNPFWG